MRHTIICFALVVAACSSNPTNVTVHDMAGLGGDLSGAAGPDLAVAATMTCGDLISCLNACTTAKCVTDCKKHSTAMAVTLNTALDNCLTALCVNMFDGGAARCDTPTDPMCDSCYSNAQSSANGMTGAGTCMPVTDPVCGKCVTQLDACFNDM